MAAWALKTTAFWLNRDRWIQAPCASIDIHPHPSHLPLIHPFHRVEIQFCAVVFNVAGVHTIVINYRKGKNPTWCVFYSMWCASSSPPLSTHLLAWFSRATQRFFFFLLSDDRDSVVCLSTYYMSCYASHLLATSLECTKQFFPCNVCLFNPSTS